jgi:hypothetical protein
MSLVFLKNPSLWTLGPGLKSEGAKVSIHNLIAEDFFDDANLDPSLWGSDIVQGSGSASMTEASGKLNIRTTASNSGALAYYKTTLNPRATSRWRVRLGLRTPQGGIIAAALVQEPSSPHIDTSSNIQGRELAEVAISLSGGVYFGYWGPSGQRYYWSSGKGWTASQEYALPDVLGKDLEFEFENNGMGLIFRVFNSDGSEVLANASVDWSSVRAEADSLYLYSGDPFNNLWYGELDISMFRHAGDNPTGQVAAMGETAIGTFIDQIPIAESVEPGASIAWRYNKDGTGFLMPGAGTLAELKAAIEGMFINTLDLEATFASDGLAGASFDINGGGLGSEPPLSFNLPLEAVELPALEVIET